MPTFSYKEDWEAEVLPLLTFLFFFFLSFIECVTILLLFHVLVFLPLGIWDLVFSSRD